jgi:hypothetical protein
MIECIEWLNGMLGDGKYAFITGDTGDLSMDSHSPPIEVHSGEDVRDFILRRQSRVSLEKACQVYDADVNAVREQLSEYLMSYPEKNPNRRYARYILRERLINYNFEAEDRNRRLTNHWSPFSVASLLDVSLGIRDQDKANWTIQQQMFKRIAPELAEIKNAKLFTTMKLGSPAQKAFFTFKKMYGKLPPALRQRTRDVIIASRSETPDWVMSDIKSMQSACVGAERGATILREIEEPKPLAVNEHFNWWTSLMFLTRGNEDRQ